MNKNSWCYIRASRGAVEREREKAMASRDVPEDVVIDILSRLPVRSLVRLRCVCKSWYALIKNPSFIAKHLLLNLMNNNNASLIVRRRHSITERQVMSLLSNETLDVSENLDFRFLEEECVLQIYGPCNGIYCIHNLDRTVVLWNPAIREFKVLPLSRVPRPPTHPWFEPDEGNRWSYDVSIGFGIDPKTNDYKVLRFVDRDNQSGDFEAAYVVELYTLSTDSWKEIDAHDVKSYFIEHDSFCDTCCVKGICYWYARALHLVGAVILSFDMSDEVFLTIPVPDIGASRKECCWSFEVLNESVALVVYPFESTEKCFDIWVLNEYGHKESWTKQFTIGPLLGVQSFLGFWKGGECLLESKTGQLVSYYHSTQEIKDLRVQGVPGWLQVVSYMESLVSIKGGYEHEQQDNSLRPFSVCELDREVY